MKQVLPVLFIVGTFLVLPVSAHASTSTDIHRDAADNNRIDGDYTLAEIQEADRTVPTQQREYTLWDDIVADYIRRLNNPDADPAPPVVAPRDFNGNGSIDAADVAEARKRTKAMRAAEKKTNKAGSTKDDDTVGAVATPDESSADEEDSTPIALIALLVGLPLLVIALGAVRMVRARRAALKDAAGEPEAQDSKPSGEERK